MAFQKRAPSIDMTSIELQSSPAPTYSSTLDAQDWPLTPPQHALFSTAAKGSTSNNPFHQPPEDRSIAIHFTGRTAQRDVESSPVKPDHQDVNHPHFAGASSKPSDDTWLPLPPRRRWPHRRVLIPWVLALLFFLTTLWFTSIALGARFMTKLHPVQHINVYLNDELMHASMSASTSTPILSLSSTLSITPTTSVTATPSETRTEALPTRSGPLAPEFEDPPIVNSGDGGRSFALPARHVETKATGFVTVTRRMPVGGYSIAERVEGVATTYTMTER
jgi:hypothetical protein